MITGHIVDEPNSWIEIRSSTVHMIFQPIVVICFRNVGILEYTEGRFWGKSPELRS